MDVAEVTQEQKLRQRILREPAVRAILRALLDTSREELPADAGEGGGPR